MVIAAVRRCFDTCVLRLEPELEASSWMAMAGS